MLSLRRLKERKTFGTLARAGVHSFAERKTVAVAERAFHPWPERIRDSATPRSNDLLRLEIKDRLAVEYGPGPSAAIITNRLLSSNVAYSKPNDLRSREKIGWL